MLFSSHCRALPSLFTASRYRCKNGCPILTVKPLRVFNSIRCRLLRRKARLPHAVLFLKRLDLNIDTGGKIELHQRVHRLLVGSEYRSDACACGSQMLARLLVNVRRTQHAVLVLDRRQRNRASYRCSGTLGRLHNLAGRGIQHAIIVCLQPYANSLSYHDFPSSPQATSPPPTHLIYSNQQSVPTCSGRNTTSALFPDP